jgi:chromosome segregation ATPase
MHTDEKYHLGGLLARMAERLRRLEVENAELRHLRCEDREAIDALHRQVAARDRTAAALLEYGLDHEARRAELAEEKELLREAVAELRGELEFIDVSQAERGKPGPELRPLEKLAARSQRDRCQKETRRVEEERTQKEAEIEVAQRGLWGLCGDIADFFGEWRRIQKRQR